MHCADPVCMIGCPTGAIHRNLSGGEVVINPITCIGCKACFNNCPYDAIRMVEIRNESGALALGSDLKPIIKATKCDLCIDQLGGPACQRACPHGALARQNLTNLNDFADWIDDESADETFVVLFHRSGRPLGHPHLGAWRLSRNSRRNGLPHGWALLACIAFLAIYNGRKKLPSCRWAIPKRGCQFHIYVGYLTFVIFLVHSNYRVPSGWFEITLSCVFGIVMLSGVGGLLISRQIPRRLATRGAKSSSNAFPPIAGRFSIAPSNSR
jgi:Fe-S-cluster-containing hydrogenase component 2